MATTEKKKFGQRIAAWFRGMKSELKKVIWPTKKQIVNNTLVVLALVVASGIVIGGFDWVASNLIKLLISLFNA